MTLHRLLSLALALALGGSTVLAQAPPTVPPPDPSASAPPVGLPGPRLQTPEEKRDAASPPNDLRPIGTVTPQIVVPLRQTAPPASPLNSDPVPAPVGRVAPAGGVDDAAARCGALTDKQARAACRDKLARESLKR